MTKTRILSTRVCVLCACALLLLGCRSARREEPLVGRLQNLSAEVEQGRVAFMQNCHMCHPQGTGGLGPSLNDKPLPGFGIRTQVRLGFGTMPAFHKNDLSSDDLQAIIAYLKMLRKQRGQSDV